MGTTKWIASAVISLGAALTIGLGAADAAQEPSLFINGEQAGPGAAKQVGGRLYIASSLLSQQMNTDAAWSPGDGTLTLRSKTGNAMVKLNAGNGLPLTDGKSGELYVPLEPITATLGTKLIQDELTGSTMLFTHSGQVSSSKGTSADFSKGAKSPNVFVVYLDPGHGGKDPGATGTDGNDEKDFNLALSNKIKALLDLDPRIQAMTTRDDDTFIPLDDRAAMANEQNASVYISIHANIAGTQGVSGTETYFTRQESVGLGNAVQRRLVAAAGFPDRGVRYSDLRVTRETTMPAVLLEIGYMSNPRDNRLMETDAFQDQVAASIVQGIKDYLQLK